MLLRYFTGLKIRIFVRPMHLSCVPYSERPAHFFVLGISFAFATLIANAVSLLPSAYMVLYASSLVAILSGKIGKSINFIDFFYLGGLYICLQPRDDDLIDSIDNDLQETCVSTRPAFLCYTLMALNAVWHCYKRH